VLWPPATHDILTMQKITKFDMQFIKSKQTPPPTHTHTDCPNARKVGAWATALAPPVSLWFLPGHPAL